MYKLTIISLAVFLTGCATSYGERSFWNDGGFSETEIQPNVFNVRFLGNEFTSKERASDFAMLRASELCLSRNLNYMEVGNVATETIKTAHVPGSSTTTASAQGFGNSAFGTSTTTYTPGTDLYSPESGLTVKCVPKNSEGSWDASFLSRSLKTKYQMNGQ
ncbi:hypothetical protein DRW07_02155 [Alteromonas sediminis]|uniref:Lipoprotein n=1 Tax=Alteromonas sediminis TaxID=2259342 RepID=A0A3N5Y4V9_9ALTE|nr:hypothetical protein [Alteromonas sediminis]RPJ68233.1 hypothetical protein DRW07_02155 [Alteromonas sediminis]